MTRLTWFECLILLAFWIGGLSAFLIGGKVAVGYVLQGLLVVVIWTLEPRKRLPGWPSAGGHQVYAAEENTAS